MTTTQNLFQQTQLAEAAYANLWDSTLNQPITANDRVITALKAEGMSESQASAFVQHWEVIDQYDNFQLGGNSQLDGLVGTGLSATVFKSRDTGEYSLAIRGSQDMADFIADTHLITTDGVAVTQLVDLYNYWQYLTHTGEYTVAKLNSQVAASTFLTTLYSGSGGNIPSELLNYFTGVSIPTTYDAARDFFVNRGFIVEAGKVYTLGSDFSTNLYLDKHRWGIGTLAGQSVNVAGHSLGGHLTMAFSRLFPDITTEAYGVNGLGFKIGDMNVYNLYAGLRNVSGISTVPGFDGGKIENVYGIAGPEFAAMNNGVLQQPGGLDGVYIESGGLGTVGGHSASQMTDSLAVYDLFIRLDSSLAGKSPAEALAQLKPLFEQGSNDAKQSLESLVGALAKIITGTQPTITTGDRESLYVTIKSLTESPAFQTLIGKVQITPPPTTATEARNDLGAFLSLYYLTPFALKTSDAGALDQLYNIHKSVADLWNDDRNLTADQLAQGEGNYSDLWLADRAAMLSWIDKRNAEDRTNYGLDPSQEPTDFYDATTSTYISLASIVTSSDDTRHITFGDNARNDTFTGGSRNDRLYGMGGADTLNGSGGADHLEGGAGEDTLNGGDDNDHLYGGKDNDTLNGDAGTDLLVGGSGDDKLYGGKDTDILYGDLQDPDNATIEGQDELHGDDGNDRLYGGGGADKLYGDKGDDDLYGNLGDDTLAGGEGIDFLKGGEGADHLWGGAADIDNDTSDAKRDFLYGEGGNDDLHGGGGNDILDGGEGNDTLNGEAGQDTLLGGDGSDTYLYKSNTLVRDIIDDSDGLGHIEFDHRMLTGTDNQLSDTTWFDEASGITYLTDGDPNAGPVNLNIIGGAGGAILVQHFYNGNLGITLSDPPPEPPPQPDPIIPDPPPDDNNPPPRRDPLLIDLTGNGIHTVAGLNFDHNGDAVWEYSGWAAPGTGMLMLDRNADGLLNDGTELFGTYTPVGGGLGGLNGFAALSQYDRNLDGRITADDPVWNQLKVWRHATDQAGNILPGDPTYAGELVSLDELGIVAIDLHGTPIDAPIPDAQGNTQLSQATITLADGSTRQIAEYQLARSIDAAYYQRTAIDIDIQTLPDLRGHGELPDLHLAMQHDNSSTLKTLVAAFAGEPDSTVRQAMLDTIIYAWAGVDHMHQPAQFGLDIRKVAVLDKVYDTTRLTDSWYGSLNTFVLSNTYAQLSEGWYASLMAQTHLKALYDANPLTLDYARHATGGDFSNATQHFTDLRAADPLGAQTELAEYVRGLKAFGLGTSLDYLAFRESMLELDPSLGWIIDNTLRNYPYPITGPGQGLFAGSRHVLGTDIADAMLVTQLGRNGDTTINGYSGNDIIYGRDDTDDLIFQESGNAILLGQGGDDRIFAGKGDDLLDGGVGNDTLNGEGGNDTYLFRRGSGQDRIVENLDGISNNTLYLADAVPADITFSQSGGALVIGYRDTADSVTVEGFRDDHGKTPLQRIAFRDGSVWYVEDILMQLLRPTEGDDLLDGYSRSDTINGLGGDDRIAGYGGDDILTGGAGDDTLIGGSGNDTYLFGRGDGWDEIVNIDHTPGDSDAIQLAADITPDDVALSRRGNDLQLAIIGTGDMLAILGWFQPNGISGRVGRIVFADGTEWGEDILGQATIIGSDGDDILSGYNGIDRMDGLVGNDTLVGQAGNDTLSGGDGTDSLFGGSGDDTLDGGTGDDLLSGGAWASVFSPEKAQVTANGNDIYRFGRGAGNDIVIDRDNTPGNLDIIQLENGLAPDDLHLQNIKGDLVVQIRDSGDTLTVKNWFIAAEWQVERIAFAEGSQWDAAQIRERAPVEGTPGDDTLQGGVGQEILLGLDGNDVLEGSNGDDTILGGTGDDLLFGGSRFEDTPIARASIAQGNGNDTYIFGFGQGHDTIVDYDPTAGNRDTVRLLAGVTPDDVALRRNGDDLALLLAGSGDTLTMREWFDSRGAIKTGSRIEQIVFDDGTAWDIPEMLARAMLGSNGDDILNGTDGADTITGLGGNDLLLGGDGNDTLDGGSGDDVLLGEGGDDMYRFGYSSGRDTLLAQNAAQGSDAIVLDVGIGQNDVVLRAGEAGDLVLALNGTADSLTVMGWFNSTTSVGEIRFADGLVWDAAAIKAATLLGTKGDDQLVGYGGADVMTGAGGNDQLLGGGGNDTLDGGAGNDTLQGGTGDDLLMGGVGNDLLIGGAGSDTYRFNLGDGQDVINDDNFTFGNVDTIELGTGIAPGDVTVSADGHDLLLAIGSDSLRIKNFSSTYGRIERLQFADGTVWSGDDLLNLSGMPADTSVLFGTPDADAIAGDLGINRIEGLAGDDVLQGAEGNDTLFGNAGNDTLLGGAGQDALYGSDVADTEADVLVGGSGDDTIRSLGGGDTILIERGDGFDHVLLDSARQAALPGFIDEAAMELGQLQATGQYTSGYWRQMEYLQGFNTIPDAIRLPLLAMNEVDGIPVDEARTALLGLADWLNETRRVHFDTGITPDDLNVQIEETAGGWNDQEIYVQHRTRIAIGVRGNDGLLMEFNTDDGGAAMESGVLIGAQAGAVQRFVFTDGTELTMADVLARADSGIIGAQQGTAGNDFLLGSAADDTIHGDAGHDRIIARDNEDAVYGEDGNDAIAAGDGRDTVDGGTGSDVLAGGAGDDLLDGGMGDDTYVFNRGDGQDTLLVGPNAGVDTLSFGVGILPEDVSAYIDPDGSLVLQVDGGAAGSVRAAWYDPAAGYTENGTLLLARVQFVDADGNARIFDLQALVRGMDAQIRAGSPLYAAALFATAGAYELTGHTAPTGGDLAVAYAQTGNLFGTPYYAGGNGATAGDDVIAAVNGGAIVDAGDGNDTVYGGDGSDDLGGGVGDDVLYGGAGDDVLRSGGGSDLAAGGAGSDTYVFNIGDGTLTIEDRGVGQNLLVLGPGIASGDLALSYTGSHLVILLGATGDTVRLAGFDPATPLDTLAVGAIRFDDGTELAAADLLALGYVLEGTPGADYLIGGQSDYQINGGAGNDIIAGGAGGDDLFGGEGDDIYLFNLGDGVDTIDDGSAILGDTVRFGPGITPDDLAMEWDGGTLLVRVGGNGDIVMLPGFERSNGRLFSPIRNFEFDDGSVLDVIELSGFEPMLFEGTDGDDVLIGPEGDDRFIPHAGYDFMAGGEGDDTYEIGPDFGVKTIDDIATDSAGNTLVLNMDAASLAGWRLSHDAENGTLSLLLAETGTEIRLPGFDRERPFGSHAVEFFRMGAGGPTLTYAELLAQGFDVAGTPWDDELLGTATTDRIVGDAGNDRIQSGTGGDIVAGGTGDDTYVFNRGDGVLTIDDSADETGGNTLEFGSGITPDGMARALRFVAPTVTEPGQFIIRLGDSGNEIRMLGFDPEDVEMGAHAVEQFRFADGTSMSFRDLVRQTFVVQGDETNNALSGTNLGDRLYGYEGNDTLSAGIGDDVLTGGIGDDVLRGGGGRDAYVFNLGDGVDVIDDAADGAWGNILNFGDGIRREDLSFSQQGATLVIGYGSGGDEVRVLNYDPSGVNGSNAIDAVELADGSVISLAAASNLAPVAVGTPVDVAASEDQWLTATLPDGLFVDPEGGVLTLTAMQANGNPLPSWLAFDPANRTFNGIPENIDVGSLDLKIVATDEFGLTATVALILSVENVNDAPALLVQPADTSVAQGSMFEYQLPNGMFADVDAGDSLVYSAALADGSPLPSWLAFDAANGVFNGVPDNADVTTLSVKVSGTDRAGATTDAVFSLKVIDVNDAPNVASLIPAQVAIEDAPFGFAVPADAFADIDAGDALAYTATLANGDLLPSWLAFDAATGTFSGVPANADVGALSVKVVVTDAAGAQASQSFAIAVANTNDAPLAQGDSYATDEDTPLTLAPASLLANDSDIDPTADVLAISMVGNAVNGTVVMDASGVIHFSPDADYNGAAAFDYTVADGKGGYATATVALQVNPVNDAPVAVAPLADLAAVEDQAFSAAITPATFTDADAGDRLAYAATLADGSPLPSWLAFDAATGTFSGTPLNADVGTLSVSVAATDLAGAVASQTFRLNVANTNDAPLANAPIADQQATEDALFAYTLPADVFVDVDAGDVLAYSATLADGSALPGWLAFDAASGTFTGMPGNADVGRLSVTVIATDAAGVSAMQSFGLNVANVNDAPVTLADIAAVGEDAVPEATGNVLANDSDIDAGEVLTVANAGVYQGAYGQLTLGADGSYRYVLDNLAAQPLGANETVVERFAYTATDGMVAAGSELAVAVAGQNDAPAAAAMLDPVALVAGAAFTWTLPVAAFTDADAGDTLAYGIVQEDGSALPSWLAFDNATRTLTGAPAVADAGALRLAVVAMDTSGAWAGSLLELDIVAPQEHGAVFVGTPGVDMLTGTAYDDVLDGQGSVDTLSGGDGNDLYLIDTNGSADDDDDEHHDQDGEAIHVPPADWVMEAADGGYDTVWSSASYNLADNVEALVLLGGKGLRGTGNGSNNLLVGNRGDNRLDGLGGNDLLLGGTGDDRLAGSDGLDALDGGRGDDMLEDGAGSGFVAGGRGNDSIRLSAGADIVAFNRGDGRDVVVGGDGRNDTVSLGGGIKLADLRLGKEGKDLILATGEGDTIRLADWYAGGNHKIVATLQIAHADDAAFDRYDFTAIVAEFDVSRKSGNTERPWTVAAAATRHPLSGAQVAGGVLAVAYAKTGNLEYLHPDTVGAALAAPATDTVAPDSGGVPADGGTLADAADPDTTDGDSADYWSQLDAPVADESGWDVVPMMADAAADWLRYAEQNGYQTVASGDARIDYAVTWARLRDELAGRLDEDDDGAPEHWACGDRSHSFWQGGSSNAQGARASLPGNLLRQFEGLKEGIDRLHGS